jgi:hypothetical protein
MRYFYIGAWAVVGGVSLAADSDPVELCQTDCCKSTLTRDPDSLLLKIDRGSAISRLMRKTLFGQGTTQDFSSALQTEIEEIRDERTKKAGGQAILVINAQGVTDAVIKESAREHSGFILTFDAVDKKVLQLNHRAEVEATMLAVAMESEEPSRFALLNEGVYLTNDAGSDVYSVSVTGRAEAVTSSFLTAEGIGRISTRYAALRRESDISSIQRLFRQMADFESDRLMAFLSGWGALEILIQKSFTIYEEIFLSPLRSAGQPNLRDRFLRRVKEVMQGKYRLADKFIAITAVLFPDASKITVDEDWKKFCRLKTIRDDIYHGKEFDVKELPIHELATLLRKYMLARLEQKTIRNV